MSASHADLVLFENVYFPSDIWVLICKYLAPGDFANLFLTCKWLDLLRQSNDVHRQQLATHFPDVLIVHHTSLSYFSLFQKSYTEVYSNFRNIKPVRLILSLIKMGDIDELKKLDLKHIDWLAGLLSKNDYNILGLIKRSQALADCIFELMVKILDAENSARKTIRGFSILHWLAILNPSEWVVNQYIPEHAKFDSSFATVMEEVDGEVTRHSLLTPLYMAASAGHARACQLLLVRGAQRNIGELADERLHRTPFYAAALAGHMDVIMLLISWYPDFESEKSQFKPIIAASEKGNVNLVRWLISRGVNIECEGLTLHHHYYATPLVAAVLNDHADVIEALVNANADLMHVVINNLPPFHHAVSLQRLNAVNKLLELRPELLDSRDRAGFTALDYARRQDCQPMIALLEQAAQKAVVRFGR